MSQRAEPPFRADHVGSLLRPPALLDAREKFARGRDQPQGRCAEAEDAAIVEAIAAQERIGLQAATDGEFRRRSWHMDFIYQLGGITKTDQQLRISMHNKTSETSFVTPGMAVTSRVELEEPIFADDFLFLSAARVARRGRS